jgi:hypothetical protein
MDFLTTTDAVGFVLDDRNMPRKPTICEVGYWFKPNPRYRDVFEMWRREDPMVDDDLITQGSFQLVHDRVKSFKVTYFRTLGYEAKEEIEWDASLEDALPKRIKVEFTIERKRSSRNVVNDVEIDDFEGAEKTYVRHFVLDSHLDDALAANNARMPVFPPPPASESTGGGGGPGGPSTAGGGPGGKNVSTTFGSGDGAPSRGRGNRGTSTETIMRGPPGQRPGSGRGPGGGPSQGLPPGFDPSQFLNRLGGQGGGGPIFGGSGGGGGGG